MISAEGGGGHLRDHDHDIVSFAPGDQEDTVTAPRSLAALVLLALVVGVASLAMAAGPLDGFYVLTLSGEGIDPFTLVLTVAQNGQQIVVLLLDPPASSWLYGLGELNAEQQVQGPLFFGDGLNAGQFSVRFQGPSVTGTATLFEAQLSLSGNKAF